MVLIVGTVVGTAAASFSIPVFDTIAVWYLVKKRVLFY